MEKEKVLKSIIKHLKQIDDVEKLKCILQFVLGVRGGK